MIYNTPIRCPLKQNLHLPAHQNYVAGANTSPPTLMRWTSGWSLKTWTPVTVNTPAPLGWPLPGKRPQNREKKYKVHTTVFKKIITDFYSTYRKTAAQRAAEDAHLTPYIFYFILYIFYSLFITFFDRSEQILEASHLTVAPLLCHWTSPSAPNPSKCPLPFLQYSKQILTTTPTIMTRRPVPRVVATPPLPSPLPTLPSLLPI